MTDTEIETVVVGAGQAGLALSRHLTDRGRDHVLLERGRVAERWHSERWDSFTLLTPNWLTRLPGWRYSGPDPDGFLDRKGIQEFFAGYARSFAAPVRTGVTVTGVRPNARGWVVRTDAGELHAHNVVVATGHLDRPAVPSLHRALPRDLVQLHTSAYRRPCQLPDGDVLVIGAGSSGREIADELARTGRAVHIAVGRDPALPYDAAVTDGRRLDLRELTSLGVVPRGRLVGVDAGDRLRFADGLPSIDLRTAGIHSVVWATGYGRNYSWLDARVLDVAGDPVQRRGVTAAPGLFFLGLCPTRPAGSAGCRPQGFMSGRGSSTIDGVGADAAFLADRIVARSARAAA